MTVFAHISDLHFGRHRPEVLAGLLKSLTEQQPEQIFISGDLTQRARRSEFGAAADFLEKLACPYLIVPGNHDLAAFNLFERFCYPWKNWRQQISDDLEPLLEAPKYTVVGINTARTWATPFNWTRGRISSKQAVQVRNRLQNSSETNLRFLIAHHPFWLPAGYEHRQLIAGRDAALQILRGGSLDLILSGHVHLAYSQELAGIIISHAGTSGSDRLLPGHPNSYNLIRGDRHKLAIEKLGWDGSAFIRQQTSEFVSHRNGWSRSN